jgi:enterochelin esterase-like enzyme
MAYRNVLLLASAFAAVALAQQPPAAPAAAPGRGPQGPQVVSPEIGADRRVTFRILAPQAQSVRLNASDIPGMSGGGRGAAAATPAPNQLTKGDNGVWSLTFGPINPGAYRYAFNVDGVTVIDPRNPSTSESNANVASMFYVPGSEFMDTRQVPRGAVAEVTYFSTALNRFRRMHVYTPPGYDLGGSQKFPVFYLLHGASDCDDSWTSVGRAGFILDNLLAAKKAKPMIVVMPAGHTNTPAAGRGGAPGAAPALDDFAKDFLTDVMPYVEKNYRALNTRSSRAIAGLSMGGSQTLNIAFLHLEKFAYVGVFSSGAVLGGGRGAAAAAPAPGPSAWETSHKASLEDASLKKGTKLVWLATGVDDSLITNTRSTVDMLKKYGFSPVFKETPGAHTWINWRDYLNEFAPQLFQ